MNYVPFTHLIRYHKTIVKTRLSLRKCSTAVKHKVIAPYNTSDQIYFNELLKDTPFEMRLTPDKGRGLYAKKDFKEGEIMYSEKAFVTTQDFENSNPNYCHSCYKPLEFTKIIFGDDNIKEYSKTHSSHFKELKSNLLSKLGISKYSKVTLEGTDLNFCGPECMNEFTSKFIHKDVNEFIYVQNYIKKSLNHLNVQLIDYSSAYMISLLAYLIKKDPSLWNESILRMTYSQEDVEREIEPEIDTIRKILIKFHPELSTSALTKENYKRLQSVIYLNGFTLDSKSVIILLKKKDENIAVDLLDDKSVRNVSMYKIASLFNHSCIPNVGSLSPILSNCLKLVALREIKKGDELVISYTKTTEPLEYRREVLLKHYQFICQCEKCLEESNMKNQQF